ncbi:MAG: cytochrome c oxidase subunit II [Cellvibrionaceae bacterium]|nr:cytochrome c oxidase subunit II [Cellvibrionaceae bacterium]
MLNCSSRTGLLQRIIFSSWICCPQMATAFNDPQRSKINMTEGVTPSSQDIFGLHMDIFWWCVAIGVVVFGVMFYSMIVHRKANGAKAANFHDSTALEVLWTIIPFIILIIMAWPATKSLIRLYNTAESDLDVVVTGYQWYWQYDYLDQGVSFFSRLSTPEEQIRNLAPKNKNYLLEVDEPLVVPTNKKIRFLVTSNDVIHAWWVPDLAVKRDAIPGYINESWAYIEKPGIYRGVCAELCGKDHGFMPIVVKAVEEEDYTRWLADRREQAEKIKALTDKTFTLDELLLAGEQVYQRACAACHGAKGEGGVGKPIAASPIATGDLASHMAMVINGSVDNPAMAAFGEQLSEVDMAAVITYQRNAFGNNTGDLVQPLDVLRFKQGQ